MNPKVSIIIPTYNRQNLIVETINSVKNQSIQNWELILVDDCSTDNTLTVIQSVAKEDERVKVFKREKDVIKGASSCRNIGLNKAKGEYIIFLDSDDLLASYCIENRIKAFEENKKCDFLVFKMQRFEEQPSKIDLEALKKIDIENPLSDFIQLNSIWQVTSPIYKKSFLKKINGFNTNLTNFEDIEIAIKSICLSKNFITYGNIDSFYRNDSNYRLKYSQIDVKKRSINSYKALLISINNIVESPLYKIKKMDLKNDITKSYKKVFLAYIKDNVKIFKIDNKEIIDYLYSNKYLTFKDVFLFYFVNNVLFKFNNIKGLGLYRFMKFLYS